MSGPTREGVTTDAGEGGKFITMVLHGDMIVEQTIVVEHRKE